MVKVKVKVSFLATIIIYHGFLVFLTPSFGFGNTFVNGEIATANNQFGLKLYSSVIISIS